MKKKTVRILVIILAAVMLLSVLVPALTVLAGTSSSGFAVCRFLQV